MAYAKGFRAPSLKELYFIFDDVNHSLFGNGNLQAEQSDNYSGSIMHKKMVRNALLKMEVRGFYNDISNLITFAQSSESGGDTLEYVNIGENKTKGLNANISLIYEELQLNVGGSYIGRYNRLSRENPVTATDYSYSKEVVGSATYLFSSIKTSLALFYKYQGELPGFSYDQNNQVVETSIGSYQLLDATLSKSFFSQAFQLAIGCKNLLDVQTIRSSFSSGGAHSSGGDIQVGTGRTYFIKLQYQFKKS